MPCCAWPSLSPASGGSVSEHEGMEENQCGSSEGTNCRVPPAEDIGLVYPTITARPRRTHYWEGYLYP